MKTFVVALAAFFVAAPALAETAATRANETGTPGEATAAQAAEDSEDRDSRRICRRVNTATGSRMSEKRICMTAREWRDHERMN